MIIRTKKVDPPSRPPRTALKIGATFFLLAFAVTLFILARVMKDSDEAATLSAVVKNGAHPGGEVKATSFTGRQSANNDPAIRPDRQTLAEQNNVIERDALKIGEKQAESLRLELETKTDLSPCDRSNLVHTIYKLESGQVILQ